MGDVEEKIAELSSVPSRPTGGVRDHLLEEMRKHLVGLEADPKRKLESVEPDSSGHLRGFCRRPPAPGGRRSKARSSSICRFELLLRIRPNRIAYVELKITKDEKDARRVAWGDQGPDIGNRFLLARLFHLALFCLHSAEIGAISNTPANNRVRAIYREMGFDKGEDFIFAEEECVTTAFEFIAEVYGRNGLSLGTAEPLPFAS